MKRCEHLGVCNKHKCDCRSTNNAFTGATTGGIKWTADAAPNSKAVSLARRKSGLTLPNGDQQNAYSAAGKPK